MKTLYSYKLSLTGHLRSKRRDKSNSAPQNLFLNVSIYYKGKVIMTEKYLMNPALKRYYIWLYANSGYKNIFVYISSYQCGFTSVLKCKPLRHCLIYNCHGIMKRGMGRKNLTRKTFQLVVKIEYILSLLSRRKLIFKLWAIKVKSCIRLIQKVKKK